eukprot:1321811-Pyramimonas_sp.AAC.1
MVPEPPAGYSKRRPGLGPGLPQASRSDHPPPDHPRRMLCCRRLARTPREMGPPTPQSPRPGIGRRWYRRYLGE